MLHGYQDAGPDHGGAQSLLVRRLLVGAPVGDDAVVFGPGNQRFEDFGGRRPRVSVRRRDSGVERSKSDGLVAEKEGWAGSGRWS
jgi:hypothetical protein